MATTAVLRSENCLNGRYHLDAFGSRPPPPSKPYRKKSNNRSPPPKSSPPPRPGRRSPPPPPPPSSKATVPAAVARPSKVLVMEKVKILKRGEDLNAIAAESLVDVDHSKICSTDVVVPGVDVLSRKLEFVDLASVYAGPAFFVSPAPSALPMPGFLARNDDEATRSLRCVLGLN